MFGISSPRSAPSSCSRLVDDLQDGRAARIFRIPRSSEKGRHHRSVRSARTRSQASSRRRSTGATIRDHARRSSGRQRSQAIWCQIFRHRQQRLPVDAPVVDRAGLFFFAALLFLFPESHRKTGTWRHDECRQVEGQGLCGEENTGSPSTMWRGSMKRKPSFRRSSRS